MLSGQLITLNGHPCLTFMPLMYALTHWGIVQVPGHLEGLYWVVHACVSVSVSIVCARASRPLEVGC